MGTIGYLGPEGTFTHAAARSFARPGDELQPMSTAVDVVRAVEDGSVSGGVIAFENSLEGVVTRSLDELIKGTESCLIAGDRVLRVSFSLFASPGTGEVTAVRSHPFALAQCSGFIEKQGLRTAETASTAQACRMVAENPEPGWGAIGPAIAGEIYGLDRLASELENEPGPETRFLLLRRSCPGPSGRDHSAFTLRPRKDEPGSLVRILQEFAARGINLTSIKSRPTHAELGEYVFFIECEGHICDAILKSAVMALLRLPIELRFLGSFPVENGEPERPAADTGDGLARQYEAMVAHVRPQ